MRSKKLNISELRPLHPQLERVFEKLLKRLIEAHLIGSTLVEGSTFTELEARAVLQGHTIHGHVIDEHLELINGKDAASFIHRLFFQREKISVDHIDHTHFILFNNIGHANKTNQGLNRGDSGIAAYTILLNKGHKEKFEYEHPVNIRRDYPLFIEAHLNKPLAESRIAAVAALAKLYFQFQMLHPYSDGNGRIGRFLLSAKAASEKGWFFHFALADGAEHLEIMMELTVQYAHNQKRVDYFRLEQFLASHLEELI